MSTPDTSQTPTPDLSASPQPSESAAPSEPTSSGETNAVAEGTAETADASAADVHESSTEGAAPRSGENQPDKKRRRRRRRKKPGAAPGSADEGATAEGATAEGGEHASAEGVADEGEGKPSEKREKRRDRPERKAGPPRERPPVNGGDIVFGKIIEITDEAILIDIPGKARAIFDRREMLLADDEEAPPAPRDRAPAASPPLDAEAGSAPGPETAAEPVAEASAVVPEPESPPAEPPAEADASATAEPEPRKDPKVPRVILEVGADFIGVVHNDGARGGLVVLTHHPRRVEAAKAAVEKAFAERATIEGLVTGVIKGGIEVDIGGLRAFAPGSHVELRLGSDLSHLVAQRLAFLVTEYAKRGRDVVLSRRSMLEEEAKRSRTEALSKLKVGEEIEGIVRSVVPFGAFIDVGGIEGLVPLQEMSHNRADGPNDVFKAGEPARVVVLKVDEKGKVWLSHKATIPDPWQKVAEKYATATRHAGKVVRIQPFGAFIELEPGVDGLVHTQDLSIRRIDTPDEVVKVGDAIEVVVAHVDPQNHKIALHPAPQGDAVDEVAQRVVPHKPVKAKVANIESGGLVVRILGVTGRNARGYVTAAGTGTPRGTELRKVFNVGQQIEAKVIEVDPRRGEVKLSIKALSEDQERNAYQQYRQQLKAEARFTFGDLLAKKGQPPR
jgi:small subunit ribosomal protein S1